MSNSLPRPDICHIFPCLTPDTRRCIAEHLDAKTEAKCLIVTSAAYAQKSNKRRLADLKAYNLVCLLIVALDSAPSTTMDPFELQAALHDMYACGSTQAFSSLTSEVQSFVNGMLSANVKIKRFLCALEDDPRHSRFLALPGTIKLLRKAHTMLCDNQQDVAMFIRVLYATRQ